MSDSITVVREAQSLDEAYEMGYRRFKGVQVESRGEFDLGPFYDTASYSNHVLPSLRCLAGYGDSGTGTWTERRDVALIEDGEEGDHPADAVIVDSSELLSRLSDQWAQGAYAAVEAAAADMEADA